MSHVCYILASLLNSLLVLLYNIDSMGEAMQYRETR